MPQYSFLKEVMAVVMAVEDDDSNQLILPKGGGGMRSRECLSLRWSSPENGCHAGCRVPTIGPLPARNDPDRELACFL